LSDWPGQNPCHQAGPDSWDCEHGRIYRIQKKGAVTKKAEDLSALSPDKFPDLLVDPIPYRYRVGLRLIAENGVLLNAQQMCAAPNGNPEIIMRNLWSLHGVGVYEDQPNQVASLAGVISSKASAPIVAT